MNQAICMPQTISTLQRLWLERSLPVEEKASFIPHIFCVQTVLGVGDTLSKGSFKTMGARMLFLMGYQFDCGPWKVTKTWIDKEKQKKKKEKKREILLYVCWYIEESTRGERRSRLFAEGVFILSSKVGHTFSPKNIFLEHPTYRF